ncbi:hypothetical protein PAV_11c01520 [Paenibacillus alvei DSM 29]|nr:hypothetical protein PAV_11c01520 [Paenibacillus alvei DSM 29]
MAVIKVNSEDVRLLARLCGLKQKMRGSLACSR